MIKNTDRTIGNGDFGGAHEGNFSIPAASTLIDNQPSLEERFSVNCHPAPLITNDRASLARVLQEIYEYCYDHDTLRYSQESGHRNSTPTDELLRQAFGRLGLILNARSIEALRPDPINQNFVTHIMGRAQQRLITMSEEPDFNSYIAREVTGDARYAWVVEKCMPMLIDKVDHITADLPSKARISALQKMFHQGLQTLAYDIIGQHPDITQNNLEYALIRHYIHAIPDAYLVTLWQPSDGRVLSADEIRHGITLYSDVFKFITITPEYDVPRVTRDAILEGGEPDEVREMMAEAILNRGGPGMVSQSGDLVENVGIILGRHKDWNGFLQYAELILPTLVRSAAEQYLTEMSEEFRPYAHAPPMQGKLYDGSETRGTGDQFIHYYVYMGSPEIEGYAHSLIRATLAAAYKNIAHKSPDWRLERECERLIQLAQQDVTVQVARVQEEIARDLPENVTRKDMDDTLAQMHGMIRE